MASQQTRTPKPISITELVKLFPDNDSAREWLGQQIWPHGPYCPRCGSFNVQSGVKHVTMTHRCRDCPEKKMFSLRTGSVMADSNLPFQTWVFAIHIIMTNPKGVSSLQLHRDLGISQKAAWHLGHRIRESMVTETVQFEGPIEVDETYVGGLEKNKHSNKKLRAGSGVVGKTAVVGAKDRATGQVRAEVTLSTKATALQGFVHRVTQPGATVYTDDATMYNGMTGFNHKSVKHSSGEYVNGEVHTNGIESFWALIKRAHKGTFHHISPKHLNRYVCEFTGRYNERNLDTIDQMRLIAMGMAGKRLKYDDLVSDEEHGQLSLPW